VNPNLGKSVSKIFLQDELRKAQINGRGAMALLASQHFNVEIGNNLAEGRWPGADYWNECADPTLTLETLIERSEVVVATIDGGGLDDWFGLSIIGREKGTKRFLCWTHAWAHESVLERYPKHVQQFQDFVRDGDLTITDYRVANRSENEDGEMEVTSTVAVDLAELVSYVMQVEESGKLGPIGVDPYGVGAVLSALEEAGIDRDERMLNVPQGYKLQGAVKTTELYLSTGSFVHSGSAMMAFCAGNARVEKKGNAVLVTKAASEGKIDPLMAAFSGIAVMMTNPEPQGVAEMFVI
jgi:phage terminase large subunit-like protein